MVAPEGLGSMGLGAINPRRNLVDDAENNHGHNSDIDSVLPVLRHKGVNPAFCLHIASLPPSSGIEMGFLSGPEAYLCC